MIDINIDTSAPGYQLGLANWRQIRGSMKQKFRLYRRLDDEKKQAWRDVDPLLDELVEFAERIGQHQNDG